MSRTAETPEAFTVNIAPVLPPNWREQLAVRRRAGYPNSQKHQWAYRNFVRACFPKHVGTTDPEALEQIEWWWVLTQLERDGAWQYWLTVPANDDDE